MVESKTEQIETKTQQQEVQNVKYLSIIYTYVLYF